MLISNNTPTTSNWEVIGYYRDDEGKPNNPKFDNWGLARANQLKQKLVKAGFPPELIIPIAKKNNTLKLEKDTVYGGLAASYQPRAISPLVVEDADNLVAETESKSLFLKPQTDKNNLNDFDKEFQKMADYLKKNPNRLITLSSRYFDDPSKNWEKIVLTLSRKG